jgi:hypothetical protein
MTDTEEKLVTIGFEKGPSFKVSEAVAKKLLDTDRAAWCGEHYICARFARCHASYEIAVAEDAVIEEVFARIFDHFIPTIGEAVLLMNEPCTCSPSEPVPCKPCTARKALAGMKEEGAENGS